MKRLFFPLFAGLLWLMSGTLSATERTYNVLFIQSYTKNTPWHSLLTENLENGLDKGGVKANITTEYLNADYWSFASECFIMRRICERARQRKTDLIVTSSDEAFFTLTHCGDSLPYQIPVVVSGIKYPDERVFERMPNVSGYVSKTDFDVLLDAAVRMFPSRRELVCLSDSSFLSLKGVRAVEDSWERIKSNYPEHELKVLNVQAKSLNSIITSICYDYNAYKHIYNPKNEKTVLEKRKRKVRPGRRKNENGKFPDTHTKKRQRLNVNKTVFKRCFFYAKKYSKSHCQFRGNLYLYIVLERILSLITSCRKLSISLLVGLFVYVLPLCPLTLFQASATWPEVYPVRKTLSAARNSQSSLFPVRKCLLYLFRY